jgi:hypothetical protein
VSGELDADSRGWREETAGLYSGLGAFRPGCRLWRLRGDGRSGRTAGSAGDSCDASLARAEVCSCKVAG